MFRKSRSHSQPPDRRQEPPRPASAMSAASVAANAAFLKRQNSNASLSSAAAAAALRSHTASPVPIGDLQTKRMIRRNSNSSVTSATGSVHRQPFSSNAQGTANVQRRASVSSMSERSFRSPSPGARHRPVPSARNAPAVPSIPPTLLRHDSSTSTSSPQTAAAHRPQKIATTTASSNGAQASPINFSRPMSPSPTSPTAPRAAQTRPASSLGFSSGETANTSRQRPLSVRHDSKPAAAAPARSNSTAARPTSSSGGKPAPTSDEIKAFQARAAALLARPRAEAYAPVPAAPPKKVDRSSSILKQGPPPAPSAQARQKVTAVAPPRQQQGHLRADSIPTTATSSSAASITSVARSLSASPARSARFSDKPVTETTVHQPPNRGISPAKSAMKGSSRPTSPAFSSNIAMSDTSDARSLLSDDGGTPGRRKKSVRVSFDETPLSVGDSAVPQSPINDIASPQQHGAFQYDDEAGMGQKPVLPSFASVRRRDNEPAEPLAGVRSRPAASVTSESSLDTTEEEQSLPGGSGAPSIAIQPATPGLEDKAAFDSPAIRSEPVGRASLEEVLSAEQVNDVHQSHPQEVAEPAEPAPEGDSLAPSDQETHDDSDEDWSDAAEDLTELDQPGYASLDAILESPGSENNTPPTTSAGPKPVLVKATNEEPAAAIPASEVPLALVAKRPEGDNEEDWDKVRAYWSGLSEQSKQQMEAAATPLPDLEAAKAANSQRKKKKAAESNDPDVQVPLPPWPDTGYQKSVGEAVSKDDSRQQSGPDSKPALRTSLRGNAGPTMRNGPAPSKPSQRPMSANDADAATALATAFNTGRPVSSIIKPQLQRSGSNDSNTSQSSFRRSKRDKGDRDGKVTMRRSMRAGREPAPAPKPKAKPAPRPMSPETPPRVSMRHSMRRNSMESVGGRSVTSTTSERSFSRLFRMGGKSKNAPPPPAPSGRSQSLNRNSSRFKSRFANDSDSDDNTTFSAFRSRLADSDDSDNDEVPALPAESIAETMAKLRRDQAALNGEDEEIAQHGASTSADRNPSGMVAPLTEANVEKANAERAGAALSSGTLRKEEKKNNRRSFFGLGRKKAASVAGDMRLGSPKSVVTDVPPLPQSPQSPTAIKTNGHAAAVADSSEPPTTPPNKRTIDIVEPASSLSAALARPEAQSSPKVGRRSFLRRLSLSSSPGNINTVSSLNIPPPPPIPDHFKQESPLKDRPNTSDGIFGPGASKRPGLGPKRDSTQTAPPPEDGAVYSMRTGRKKKFQGLRRRLGLYD